MKNCVFQLLVFVLLCGCSAPVRYSFKGERAEDVHYFLLDILRKEEIDDNVLATKLKSLSLSQTADLGCICRVTAYRGTEMDLERVSDAAKINQCYMGCLRRLNEENSIAGLRRIYFTVRIEDGWLDEWHHVLGANWHKRLLIDE